MSNMRLELRCIAARPALIAAIFGVLIAVAQSAPAQTERVLYSFRGGADGYYPHSSLLLTASALYGTTLEGGAYGAGTVFKVGPSGAEKVVYTFTGGADGGFPFAGLITDREGNFYGTTIVGGTYNFGAVFEITSSGIEKVLYSFTGALDGGGPVGSLVRDAKGNLYGLTEYGGSSADLSGCSGGCGTEFVVNPAGSEKVLHNFTGGADGGYPVEGLMLAGGYLYGVTPAGGAYGFGTVFKTTLAGKETVLYSFTGGNDGAEPRGNLVRDGEGNLYGTTIGGGNSNGNPDCGYEGPSGCGTVFELTPAGVETVLYSFTGTDGASPFTGVVRDAEGNLYGATSNGGNSACMFGCGTVFEVTKAGTEQTLYAFGGGADGANPSAGLERDAKGNLYGAAAFGGDSGCNSLGCGVIFKVTP